MELTERGLLTSDLRFGRADLFTQTLEDIALRRGLGDELTEGSYRLAEAQRARLSMTVKSWKCPPTTRAGCRARACSMPPAIAAAATCAATCSAWKMLGLPKLIDRLQVQGKASFVTLHQNSAAILDSLVACKFVNIAVAEEYLARALTSLTGISYSTGELIRAGERIWNLERLYNLREGFSRADDTLPPRLLDEPATGAGQVSHLEPCWRTIARAAGMPTACLSRPARGPGQPVGTEV